MAPIEPFPFRFRDPLSGKWTRARYVATLAEIRSRYREWEIIGPPEIRGDEPVRVFQSDLPTIAESPLDLQPQFAMPPRIVATERFLRRVFLRRYITCCARGRRFTQMQGAAPLYRKIGAT